VTPDAISRTFARTPKRVRAICEVECAVTGGEPDPAFLRNACFHGAMREATYALFEEGPGVMNQTYFADMRGGGQLDQSAQIPG
jgi:hypothetical protein